MWKIEQKQWEWMGNIGQTETNAIVTIETNLIQNISIAAKAQMVLPQIVINDVIRFEEIVQVGSIASEKIDIQNPSNQPLEVQFFMASPVFYTGIIERITQEGKIHNWVTVCNHIQRDQIEKQFLCNEFERLFETTEERRRQLLDFFL